MTGDLFIEDGDGGVPILWRHNPDRPDYPTEIVSRYGVGREAFDAIAALLDRCEAAERDRDELAARLKTAAYNIEVHKINYQRAALERDDNRILRKAAEAKVACVVAVAGEHRDVLTARGKYPERLEECACLGCQMIRAALADPEEGGTK